MSEDKDKDKDKDKDYYDNGEYEDDYDYVVCFFGKDDDVN